MEKQHNRGQDGAGVASIKLDVEPGRRYISRYRSNNDKPIKEIFDKIVNYSDLEIPSKLVKATKITKIKHTKFWLKTS